MIIATGNKNKRLGKYIHSSLDATMISRENNYDLNDIDDIRRLAFVTLDYEVFINNSKLDDFNQIKLLDEVHKEWVKDGKTGHIINIGSTALYNRHNPRMYNHEKAALRDYSLSLSRKYQETGIKVSYLCFSLVDLPDRTNDLDKDGIDPDYIIKTLNDIIDDPYQITEMAIGF